MFVPLLIVFSIYAIMEKPTTDPRPTKGLGQAVVTRFLPHQPSLNKEPNVIVATDGVTLSDGVTQSGAEGFQENIMVFLDKTIQETLDVVNKSGNTCFDPFNEPQSASATFESEAFRETSFYQEDQEDLYFDEKDIIENPIELINAEERTINALDTSPVDISLPQEDYEEADSFDTDTVSNFGDWGSNWESVPFWRHEDLPSQQQQEEPKEVPHLEKFPSNMDLFDGGAENEPILEVLVGKNIEELGNAELAEQQRFEV